MPYTGRGGGAGGAVASVFGRIGAIIAAIGDYTAAQVTNAADKATATKQTFVATVEADTLRTAAGGVRLAGAGPGGENAIQFSNDTTIYRKSSGVWQSDSRAVIPGVAANTIASGALPTVSPSSGTAFQCSTTRDVFLTVPVTFNGGGADATCLVEMSPDNVTFSTLATVTEKLGSINGDVRAVSIQVPAGWRVKLTVTNATLGTGTYY